MTQFRVKQAYFRHCLAVGAAAIALAGGTTGTAHAQSAPEQAQVKVDIPAGTLAKSLMLLGRQANVQIAFLPDRVKGRRAARLHGTYTIDEALTRLLNGSTLRYQKTQAGTYVVGGPTADSEEKIRRISENINNAEGREADGKAAIPDILVVGGRNWNLNLDIPRTADDSQPYVVFSHQEIQRSGATSLEDFFRNNLGANATGSLSTQAGGSKGQSLINLRGLGPTGTLVLVDGRRYAQANTGVGAFTQSSINGINLDAIERIEVLASSASGIYGSNAVGGVVNIIMRRNYNGMEATAYYGNTSRFDAGEKRLNLSGSFSAEGGKTRISVTGGWQQNDGLMVGERDYVARGRAQLLSNAPSYFDTITTPVSSTTPNITSSNGGILTLKPQYGGQSLGARTTYIPAGFRGIAQDGVAALIANAGKQNLALSPTVLSGQAGDGMLSALITPSQTYSGSVSVRREFNKWLSLYGEFGYSRYETKNLVNPAAGIYSLEASSAGNPFNQDIQVTVPIGTGNRTITNISTTKRALAGAIVKLPLDWQAAIDLTWNWTIYDGAAGLPGFDKATSDGTKNGAINLLKDVSQFPIQFGYLDAPRSGLLEPSDSYSRSYALTLAGPVPLLRLWGGKPILTLKAEQTKQVQGEYKNYSNTADNSSINYTPERSQRTDSVYGEVVFPILGKDNHIPLVHELELRVAGRYDNYVGVGAKAGLNCFPALGQVFNAPLPASAYTAPCPQAGAQPVFATTRNSSTNPTVSMRWAVSPDIMFRGSYATGYLPPLLNSVVSETPGLGLLIGKSVVNVTDPLRGNERIGDDFFGILRAVPSVAGGNPDVKPQTSTSWSFGAVLTPRVVPGLRLSADWSRIVQNNVYFQPSELLTGATFPGGQQIFNDFLAAHPERFKRDTNQANFGPYSVGKIIFADITTANISFARSEAIDFAASYDTNLGNGRLSLQGSATWMRDLTFQTTPSSKLVQSAGVVSNSFLGMTAVAGGVRWKGTGSIVYSTDRWTLGLRGRYFGPTFFNVDHSVERLQGSAQMPGQAYFDLFGSYKVWKKTELRVGVNNVFDKSPPINSTMNLFYSQYGDPRRANFYLSINQKF